MKLVQPIRDRAKIEEMKRKLSANPRDVLLFTLGINSGLRIGDILDMRVSDVIDDNGTPRGHYDLIEGKTNKYKRFAFAPNVKSAILDYLRDYTGPRDRFLFASRKGNAAITRVQAWRIINEAAAAVGINDNIGCHTTRKTFGYHAFKAGTDIALLQQIFNHSAPSVTLRYIGITQDDMDNVTISLNL